MTSNNESIIYQEKKENNETMVYRNFYGIEAVAQITEKQDEPETSGDE